MSWKKYCKKWEIKFEFETDCDVRFTAPKGNLFGNGSPFRFVEDIDEMDAREIESVLIYS